jgi:hypothetical protein
MRVISFVLQRNIDEPARSGRVNQPFSRVLTSVLGDCPGLLLGALALAWVAFGPAASAQTPSAIVRPETSVAPHRANLPPRVIEAQRFLARRGWTQGNTGNLRNWRAAPDSAVRPMSTVGPQVNTAATATWQPLGPTAVSTPNVGLVTGRVSALALDPADATGNRLYVGTTGGGVWVAQNAGTSNPSSVVLTPLTDSVGALSGAKDASISIGALTVQPVQPGRTGVILAGTGDPNDALDSYYGAGILRSSDGGNTWSLISTTRDAEQGLSGQDFSFVGEGFAGFAWSTDNPQLVVAAVSQAYEGKLVNAEFRGVSYEGLYYSDNADLLGVGVSWHLATITDGAGADVQGPLDPFAGPNGNAATSVVWNPVRHLFIAAVRYHGYYQSVNGTTWTRMLAQPGSGLTTHYCPTNPTSIGSIDCPIFRGTLAVNPLTGDTFAWTVNINNQDQGLWQDQCAVSGGACANQGITFAQRWNTSALETNTTAGVATIENGDYNLVLAAVPSGQDTLLMAGANDLWKCSLAMGCVWRNTTNATTCMSAQVGEFQHALAWNPDNPLEIYVGNDSGLWRSEDAIGETGQVCAATDATHFQNLNGSLGSLAEVVSMSQAGISSYTMMTGLGVNGTAGVKKTTAATEDWPQILGGEGGPVAIDPRISSNWYVNNQVGVSIHLCAQSADCTQAAFGVSPVVSDEDVGGDGYTMTTPAPFMVDPVDPTQLLVGTCRVWRGPADGIGWRGSNAISPILDSPASTASCNGDSLIRSMAAIPLAGGGELVYVGMFGSANGSTKLPGHVLSATIDPAASGLPVWQDLTLNPVTNDNLGMNAYGLDISSIIVDPHDLTGKTVYVTVEAMPNPTQPARVVYRSSDGGAHWAYITANLPAAPASSLAVDPQDASTVYIATDKGVYFTTRIATCMNASSECWSAFGTGLPGAPVVQLSASPLAAPAPVLVAATYGRGIWQTPLWTAKTGLTTAIASPANPVTFPTPAPGSSNTLTVTLKNTGTLALTSTSPPSMSVSDFRVTTDNCTNTTVAQGGSCTFQVTFTPTETGTRTGQMTIFANVYGGQLPIVELTGTSVTCTGLCLSATVINFNLGIPDNGTELGNASTLPLTVDNGTATAVTYGTPTGPFSIASTSCPGSVPTHTSCGMKLTFTPIQAGAATGTLSFNDQAGTQTVYLSGTGLAPPTDTLSASVLSFPDTIEGQSSTANCTTQLAADANCTITLTNSGDIPLTGITVSVSAPFSVSGSCTVSTLLAASSSCAINVQFSPSQLGLQSRTLTVTATNALGIPTVALSGTGIAAPAISVLPPSLTFAAQQVGVASSPMTITVSNSGGAPMANVGFRFTGAASGSFTTGATSCPTSDGATLANGTNCTVQVIFKPAATGGSAAVLTISSSTLGVMPVNVSLNGIGTAMAGLNVTPPQLTFPAVVTGLSSAAQTVTITNTSSFAATSLTLSVSAPFSLTQNTCTTSLASGTSCSVGVIFTPTTVGPITGTLTITSASITTPANVLLSGTGGVTAAIQVEPASINFATVGVGATSSPTIVTVTNPGTVNGLSAALALAVPSGFQLINNTCPSTLAPQASCTTGVVFAPTSAGALTGNFTVTSSTVSGGPAVSLSGTGFDFKVAVSGSSSVTVASGQAASYTLVITPAWISQAQFSPGGTFTFQCGTLPTNVLCLFNPTSEPLSAGATGNVTVQLSTGKSGSAALSPGPAEWRIFPLACGLLLLPFALPLGWKRRWKALPLLLLLAILAGGVSSCTSSGGGTGGSPSGPGGGAGSTPAGTYTIPVTVISTGVQHSLNLTLTVD